MGPTLEIEPAPLDRGSHPFLPSPPMGRFPSGCAKVSGQQTLLWNHSEPSDTVIPLSRIQYGKVPVSAKLRRWATSASYECSKEGGPELQGGRAPLVIHEDNGEGGECAHSTSVGGR